MPEAFAVLFVFVVAVSAYVAARVMTANATVQTVQADRVRLRQHRVWLEERMKQAWQENWDQEMRDRIADEIELADAQLERAFGLEKSKN